MRVAGRARGVAGRAARRRPCPGCAAARRRAGPGRSRPSSSSRSRGAVGAAVDDDPDRGPLRARRAHRLDRPSARCRSSGSGPGGCADASSRSSPSRHALGRARRAPAAASRGRSSARAARAGHGGRPPARSARRGARRTTIGNGGARQIGQPLRRYGVSVSMITVWIGTPARSRDQRDAGLERVQRPAHGARAFREHHELAAFAQVIDRAADHARAPSRCGCSARAARRRRGTGCASGSAFMMQTPRGSRATSTSASSIVGWFAATIRPPGSSAQRVERARVDAHHAEALRASQKRR